MATDNQDRATHTLRVTTTDGNGIPVASGLCFMVGDLEIGGVKSFKMGERNGDGTIRANDIVYATLEVAVKLG